MHPSTRGTGDLRTSRGLKTYTHVLDGMKGN